jgi:signal transduction histidine kinase
MVVLGSTISLVVRGQDRGLRISMATDPKPINRAEWTLVALRALFIVVIGLLLMTATNADGQRTFGANPIGQTLLVAVLVTILPIIPLAFPTLRTFLPIMVILGDWLIAGACILAFEGDMILQIGFAGMALLMGILHLGLVSGLVDAIGGLVVMIAVLASRYNGVDLGFLLSTYRVPLIVAGAAGLIAWVSNAALRYRIAQLDAYVQEVEQSKVDQAADLRERTRIIYDIAATMSTTLHYDKILHSVMNAGALGLRDIDSGMTARLISAVMLFRSTDNQLHVVYGRGLTAADEARSSQGTSGIIGEALEKCIPVVGSIARKDPELQYFVGFQYVRSTLAIPLRAGYDNYGVLLFASELPDIFTEEHTELLAAVGTQATIALQNAVLYENLLQERDKIVEVEEEARKKLARDLHDGPTQSVAAIAMRMGIIARLLEKAPADVPSELKKVEDLARKTTKEIRHMLFTMRPLVLENQGLAAALQQLGDKTFETHEQKVTVRVARDVERLLDQHQQGVVFYIIEEAVGNARKHAKAEMITISIQPQDDIIIVKISDNGAGFDTNAVLSNYDSRGSLGMVNLRERTELLSGTLSIESAVGKGTTITVLIPVKQQTSNLPPPKAGDAHGTANLALTGSTSRLAQAAVNKIRATSEGGSGR